MNATLPFRYHLLIFRREQLALPAGLWALFALMAVFLRGGHQVDNIAASFLVIVLPLLGGILATATLVDDPVIELHLASPRRPWRTLWERMALILAIAGVAAVAYQVFLLAVGVDISFLGDMARRQLAWLVPTVAMMCLAAAVSALAAQSMAGAMTVGLIWLLQLLARGWFAADPVFRYAFLFLAQEEPQAADLPLNYLCLLAMALVLGVAASLALRKEERYL
jgi:hypothetical protein